jgi:hypothetical protein
MSMAMVKHWHIWVDTNGNAIGKPTHVGLSVALTTHPLSSAEVKERVELYLYSPSGPSWSVIG